MFETTAGQSNLFNPFLTFHLLAYRIPSCHNPGLTYFSVMTCYCAEF